MKLYKKNIFKLFAFSFLFVTHAARSMNSLELGINAAKTTPYITAAVAIIQNYDKLCTLLEAATELTKTGAEWARNGLQTAYQHTLLPINSDPTLSSHVSDVPVQEISSSINPLEDLWLQPSADMAGPAPSASPSSISFPQVHPNTACLTNQPTIRAPEAPSAYFGLTTADVQATQGVDNVTKNRQFLTPGGSRWTDADELARIERIRAARARLAAETAAEHGIKYPDFFLPQHAALYALCNDILSLPINSRSIDAIKQAIACIEKATHTRNAGRSPYFGLAQDIYNALSHDRKNFDMMQAISRLQTPTSEQAAALAHIITDATINDIAALQQRLPDATRAALSEELVLLNDAHHLVTENKLNEAAALLDPFIDKQIADYLKRHGFVEEGGILRCTPKTHEPASSCGIGAQAPVVSTPTPCLPEAHIADTPCSTGEQLKPAEQLPNCGTGDIIKQQPEPVDSCNWNEGRALPSFGDTRPAPAPEVATPIPPTVDDVQVRPQEQPAALPQPKPATIDLELDAHDIIPVDDFSQEKISHLEEVLAGVPGADAAIKTLEEIIAKGGHLGHAKGILFELEVAAQEIAKGGTVLGINKIETDIFGKKEEIDIVLSDKFIECKNKILDTSEKIESFKNQIGRKLKTARDNNIQLVVHFKQPVPQFVLRWLTEKGIAVIRHYIRG